MQANHDSIMKAKTGRRKNSYGAGSAAGPPFMFRSYKQRFMLAS
jgi:hypothetical protein